MEIETELGTESAMEQETKPGKELGTDQKTELETESGTSKVDTILSLKSNNIISTQVIKVFSRHHNHQSYQFTHLCI